MGKLRLAFKIIGIIPELIKFIETAIDVLKDRKLEPDEAARLVKEGGDILRVIK